MKTITKNFEVYSFDELKKDAQNKVINDTVGFIMETGFLTPDIKKAVKMADDMRTPWFTGEYIWDYAKEDVLEIVKDYEYLVDGNIFNV
jgi:hypothetical protein